MAVAAPMSVSYTLKQPGNVSAAIYDAKGRMVRELSRAEPKPAGAQQFFWDGLDRTGQPAPVGKYTWKVLSTPGLRSEYLMSVGTSVGSQWYPGNHAGPGALAVADDSFVIAAAAEGPPEITRTTFDGKVLWERGSFEPARGPRDIAIAGGKVFYLQNNGKIHVLDFATGKSLGAPLITLVPVQKHTFESVNSESSEAQTFNFDTPNGDYFLRFTHGDDKRATGLVEMNPNGREPGPTHRVIPDRIREWQIPASAAGAAKPIFLPQIYGNPAAVTVADRKLSIKFIPRPEKDKPVFWQVNEMEVLALPDCVAARGEELVVSSSGAGVVMWLNAATGEILDTAPVPGVRDIVLGADGTVCALTSNSLVTLTRAAKTPVVRLKGLVNPVGLALDTASGEFLVADGGPQGQIKRFTRNRTPSGTFGRAGGRLAGRYEARDFAGVSAVAADGHGGFLVAEATSAPRRLARFDRTGAPVTEWFGGMGFYAHTSLDPENPSIGWQRPQENTWMLKVAMDYKARNWRPVAAYRWDELLNQSFFPSRVPEYTHFRCLRRDINVDGKKETLLWSQALPGLILVEDEARGQLRPLAAMGVVDAELFDAKTPLPVEKLPAAWVGAIKLAGGDPADAKNRVKYARYSWADANGDGVMQAAELQLGAGAGGFPPAKRVDDDLSLWQGMYHTDLAGIYTRYKPARYTKAGAPVWDLNTPEIGPKTPRKAQIAALSRDKEGRTFALLLDGGDGTVNQSTYDMQTHGWNWPASLYNGSALMELDAAGDIVWESGPKAARWPHPRGQLMSPRNINGFVKDCIAVGDQTEQPCEFWTRDGLYVGGLFDGRNEYDGSLPGGKPDRVYTWLGTKGKRIGLNSFAEHSLFAGDDMLMGGSVGELSDGSVVFLGQGANNNPAYRITGWDNWQRLSGTLQVAQAPVAAQRSGKGLLADYFATPDLAGAALSRVEPQVWYGRQKPWPADAPKAEFSGRWSGFIEPLFSESYTFSVYARGEFKLWIDGKEVEWTPQDYPRDRTDKKGHTVPIPLRAGERVAVRLEFKSTVPEPTLHLNWESLSQPVEHIPQTALYIQTP